MSGDDEDLPDGVDPGEDPTEDHPQEDQDDDMRLLSVQALSEMDEETLQAILERAKRIPTEVVAGPNAGRRLTTPSDALEQNRPRIGGYFGDGDLDSGEDPPT